MGNTFSKQLLTGVAILNLGICARSTNAADSMQTDQRVGTASINIDHGVDETLRKLLAAAQTAMYPIYARIDGESVIPIEVPVDGTVKDLRNAVATASGKKPSAFSMQFLDSQGELETFTLEDDERTLADLGIVAESELQVTSGVLQELRKLYPSQQETIDAIVARLTEENTGMGYVFWKPPRGAYQGDYIECRQVLIVNNSDDELTAKCLVHEETFDSYKIGLHSGLQSAGATSRGELGSDGEWN